MQPEDPDLGTPRYWLSRARSSLQIARYPVAVDVWPADHCYHAQQAAEKAIKALYEHTATEIPLVHDIQQLLDGLPRNLFVPGGIASAHQLTRYAVHERYGGRRFSVSEAELAEAIELARAVVRWAASIIEPDPQPS